MAIGILIEIKVAATSLRTLADSLEAAANRASGAQVLALSAGCEVEATGKRPRETSPDGSERKAALEQLYIYIYILVSLCVAGGIPLGSLTVWR